MPSVSDVAKLGASTTGASSPISIPLTGSPVQSGASAPNNINFGTFQVGGSKNDASANLPTPNNLFGAAGGADFGGIPIPLLVAIGAAAFLLMHGFKK